MLEACVGVGIGGMESGGVGWLDGWQIAELAAVP